MFDISIEFFHFLKKFKNNKCDKFIPSKYLNEVSIDICSHCNLNCRGCDHFSPVAQPSFYDLVKFEKDIKRLYELFDDNIGCIKLMGGEPLLNPDVLKYCEITRKYFKNSPIKIVSNGILIDKQSSEFYEKIHDLNIIIEYTKYPINLNYEEFENIAKKYNICIRTFSRCTEEIKTSYKIPLDLEGKQNIKENFANCFHAKNCLFLKYGKLYTCTVAPSIEHFNKYFNKNIPLSENDGIDIYKVKDKKTILKFLARPIPFCKYCNVKGRTFKNEWGISKKDINEWI